MGNLNGGFNWGFYTEILHMRLRVVCMETL